jgi:hypothetical protein
MQEGEASSSGQRTITLTVSHRGTSHTLTTSPDATLHDFQLEIEEKTDVPPEFQKLLYKGKKAGPSNDEITLEAAGMKDGTKITLMGSTLGEIKGMKNAENEKSKRDEIYRRRAEKGPSKVW